MIEATERIKLIELREKIMDPIDVVKKFIPKKATIACGGMMLMASPKVIPAYIAKYVKETGEHFEFNLYTSGSGPPELDGSLAKINAIKRRYAYQNNPIIRDRIQEGVTEYVDIHLSEFPDMLRYRFLNELCGSIDVAIIEAVAIKSNGGIIPSLSVDITPTIVQLAKKVIIEVNTARPPEFEGLHDIYTPKTPPMRDIIPITKVDKRIGEPYVPCDPKKIVAIVESRSSDREVLYGKPTAIEERIAENLLDFLINEVNANRLPRNLLPIQTGIGPVGDAIVSALTKSDFKHLLVWSEVMQNSYLDLIDSGKLDFASASCLYLPPHAKKHIENFISDVNRYKRHIVLRPIEITNSHEVIRRLGIISINQAIEFDIYGFVNITHVLGSKILNAIGGSAELARDAYISIYVTQSTTKNGRISRIVPMVTHVDVIDHDVDVVITEQGWADLRGKSPRERAKEIIEKCADPDYKDMLWNYFKRACEEVGGHMPHILGEAYLWHLKYMETGSMK